MEVAVFEVFGDGDIDDFLGIELLEIKDVVFSLSQIGDGERIVFAVVLLDSFFQVVFDFVKKHSISS